MPAVKPVQSRSPRSSARSSSMRRSRRLSARRQAHAKGGSIASDLVTANVPGGCRRPTCARQQVMQQSASGGGRVRSGRRPRLARASTRTLAGARRTPRTRTRANTRQRRLRARSTRGGGGLALPHTSTAQGQHRGVHGDSTLLGSSVPVNRLQKAQAWYNGESTVFTPSASDPTVTSVTAPSDCVLQKAAHTPMYDRGSVETPLLYSDPAQTQLCVGDCTKQVPLTHETKGIATEIRSVSATRASIHGFPDAPGPAMTSSAAAPGCVA